MSAVVAELQAQKVHRQIFAAGSVVGVATIGVKLVALVKEFIVAGHYGRSDALEAFLIAALVPALIINLVAESMNQALIPTLVRVREFEGHGRAQQLLSNSIVCSSLLLLIASLVMALAARFLFPLIGSTFSSSKVELAIHLFYALLPVILLTGIASNCTAVLNTVGRFALPAVAPGVTPLAIIICVPLFSKSAGIWVVVYATLGGALIHAVWMGAMMRSHGYGLSMRWCGMNEDTREVARQYGPVMLSGIVASGGLLVDQSMAAMLPAGSVSALAYAGRFVGVALSLLGGAVSSAVTPHFSETIARRDWSGCRSTLRSVGWSSFALAALVTAGLMVGARTLVRLTFQHGAFGVRDTSAVSSVLMMYALQIPFFVCSRVFYRFLIAMRRTDLALYCGVLNLLLDIVLNLALMRMFGVAGIALATSLWTVSTLIFLWYWSRRVLLVAEAN